MSYLSTMEKTKKKQFALMWGLIGSIVVADQILKIWVKTHMYIGEDIPLFGDWGMLHFVENEGFAFGISFGGTVGKLFLSLFRLVSSILLIWYMSRSIRKGVRTPLLLSLTIITAGAIGNLIDSCFYGLIFNESTYAVAQMFPPEGGYAPFFLGRVVDMFYFPLFETTLPEWLPFWGGDQFVFFDAIFNIADIAVTVGAFWLIIYLAFLTPKEKKKDEESKQEEAKNTEKASN